MVSFLIILSVAIFLLIVKPSEVISQWHHYFDEYQFLSQDFYTAVEQGIRRREIPEAAVGNVSYFEGSVITQRRAYFRVSSGGFIFDICASPYGTGFFVSWWLRESKNTAQLFLERVIPLTAKKTYFQRDTETMFCESVHRAVLEAIDLMAKQKGLRGPSELERQVAINPRFAFKG